jgi:predicted amidohydrolase
LSRNRKYTVRSDLFVKYFKNSLAVDSPEMDRICAAAKETGTVVVLGYSEKAGDSLYMGQSIIDSTGELVLSRRKIKPTHMERTIFGDAAGGMNTLLNVADTAVGRVCALVCWVRFETEFGCICPVFDPRTDYFEHALVFSDQFLLQKSHRSLLTAAVDR